MRSLVILACLGWAACFPVELLANDELDTLVSRWRNNRRKIEQVRCEFEITRGVIRDEADWRNSPWYSPASIKEDAATWTVPAEVDSRVTWMKAGVREYGQQVFFESDQGASGNSRRQVSLLKNDQLGIFVRSDAKGGHGVILEDVELQELHDAVPVPFDYLLDCSPRDAFGFDMLAARVGRDLTATVQHEPDAQPPRVVVHFTTISKPDGGSIEFTLLPTEGCLPEKIVVTAEDHSVTTVHVPERKQVDGGSWVPWRIISVSERANQTMCVVSMLQISRFDVDISPVAGMKVHLPKSTILRFGNQWDSQFRTDVDQDVDFTRLRELAAQVRMSATSEPQNLNATLKATRLPPSLVISQPDSVILRP